MATQTKSTTDKVTKKPSPHVKILASKAKSRVEKSTPKSAVFPNLGASNQDPKIKQGAQNTSKLLITCQNRHQPAPKNKISTNEVVNNSAQQPRLNHHPYLTAKLAEAGKKMRTSDPMNGSIDHQPDPTVEEKVQNPHIPRLRGGFIRKYPMDEDESDKEEEWLDDNPTDDEEQSDDDSQVDDEEQVSDESSTDEEDQLKDEEPSDDDVEGAETNSCHEFLGFDEFTERLSVCMDSTAKSWTNTALLGAVEAVRLTVGAYYLPSQADRIFLFSPSALHIFIIHFISHYPCLFLSTSHTNLFSIEL